MSVELTLIPKVKVWVTQSGLTLCNPMDCSPPDSSVHGTLQAKLLEWVAIPFSRGTSWPRDQTCVSCVAGRFLTISKGGYKMPPLDLPLSHPLSLRLRGFLGFPGDSVVKHPPANAGDTCLISGLGRPHGEGNGNPLQYSCLEILRDRGAWWATVHGVAEETDTT